MKNNPISIPTSDDLIFEILTGLPVKSLLRFRCVCKRWRSMISDATFSEVHRSRSATALLISVPDMHIPTRKCTLVSLKEGEARLPFVPGIDQSSCWNISQSVNGLVCIYEHNEISLGIYRKRAADVIVYNPTTREHVTLPPSTFPFVYYHCQYNYLGFDAFTKTYKILRVWMYGPGCMYEIFTLGGGAWRIIRNCPVGGLATKGICLNGTIYWAKSRFVEGQNPYFFRQNVLIAFDVGEEKFREVPVPPAAREWKSITWKGITWHMIEFDGRIAIIDFNDVVERRSTVITMWKLEDSVNGVWSEKIIVLPEFCISSNWRLPSVASIDNGEITLIPSCLFMDWYVFHYNLEEESARKEVISRSPQNDWNCSFARIDRSDISVYKESVTYLKEICRL